MASYTHPSIMLSYINRATLTNLQHRPLKLGGLMYRSIPKPPSPPPPGKTPGHLTFLKNFGQIPCYVASLDGQIPHLLGLQRGSNPPPSRENRIAYLWFGNKFCKIFSHYEFLVQLVFAPRFKQRHIPRYNYKKRQQQKKPTWNRQDQQPVNAAHVL